MTMNSNLLDNSPSRAAIKRFAVASLWWLVGVMALRLVGA